MKFGEIIIFFFTILADIDAKKAEIERKKMTAANCKEQAKSATVR